MSHTALRLTPIELFLCAFFGLLAFLDNFRLGHLDYCNLRGCDDFFFDSSNGNDQFSGICDHPDPFAEFQITDMYGLSDEEIADLILECIEAEDDPKTCLQSIQQQ